MEPPAADLSALASKRCSARQARREARRLHRRTAGVAAASASGLGRRIAEKQEVASAILRRMNRLATGCQRRVRGNRCRWHLHRSAALVPLQALVRGVLCRARVAPKFRAVFLDKLLFRVDTAATRQSNYRWQRAAQHSDLQRLSGLQLGASFMQRAASRAKPIVIPATALCARAESPPEKGGHVSQATPLAESEGAWPTGGPQSNASLHSFYCNIDERERGFIGLPPPTGPGTALPTVSAAAHPRPKKERRIGEEQSTWLADGPLSPQGSRRRRT